MNIKNNLIFRSMNAKEALVEIKKLLFSEAEKEAAFAMTEGKLVDGTIVAYDLETGEIFVVGAEGESVEIEASAEEVPAEEPVKDEAMAKVEQAMGDLEKKVEELAAKVEEMAKKNEEMKQAVQLSAVVIESLAKEPSDKAISAPNSFHKAIKVEKDDRFANIQKAFQILKQK